MQETCHEARRVALVTGSSRGIGAATALALARRGFDIVITYRNKASRAQAVAEEAERLGVRAMTVAGDLTERGDLHRLAERVGGWSDRLDVLVLNASGGLERDIVAADPDYPRRINRDAQLAALDELQPLMRGGGTVIFVTSHWAHLYGQVEQLPGYAPVAESKFAGEQALRGRQKTLEASGIRLLIVTGDLIEGTITPKLLERASPGLKAQRETVLGALPSAGEMGEAIASAAVDPALAAGHTVVVGGRLSSLR